MKGRESGMPEESLWQSFFDPEEILNQLDLVNLSGSVVEFGCGYGTFSLTAARRISGRVFTFDIDPQMVSITQEKARTSGLQNLSVCKRDFLLDGTGLPTGEVEYAMIFNLLHVEEPTKLLSEACRVLAPGGKLGLIHWRSDIETPRGPSSKIRPTAEQCRRWAEMSGFVFRKEALFSNSPWHWGILMSKIDAE